MRLVWKSRAVRQLEKAAEWSPKQARAVVDAMEQMAQSGWSLGRPVGHGRRYMPVRPLGVFYRVIGDDLVVVSVVDARRLRVLPGSPPPAGRSEENRPVTRPSPRTSQLVDSRTMHVPLVPASQTRR